MKKVGNLTEARMVKPAEPKFHSLVSDNMFENKVKGYPAKGIKGGTAAAAKMAARKKKGLIADDSEVPNPDKLPMNQTPEASKMTTNSPRRATKASVQVGGPFDLTASQKGKRQDEDNDWIQDAEADIKRRGTKGKCTPITKPGCTGKAKALAKTFKKMAKEAVGDASTEVARRTMTDAEIAELEKKRKEWKDSMGSTGGTQEEAFEPLATPRGTAKPVRKATARAKGGKALSNKEHGAVMNNPTADPALRTTSADQHTPSTPAKPKPQNAT